MEGLWQGAAQGWDRGARLGHSSLRAGEGSCLAPAALRCQQAGLSSAHQTRSDCMSPWGCRGRVSLGSAPSEARITKCHISCPDVMALGNGIKRGSPGWRTGGGL